VNDPSQLIVATIVSEPFEENTFVTHLRGRTDCLVIDPGLEPERIIEYLDAHELTPAAILNTHGHIDHIAGNGALKQKWPACPLVIGKAEAAKLTNSRLNLSATMGFDLRSPAADATVEDGQVYSAAGFDLEVRALPGHSVGHVVFLWKGHSPYVVFVGDVIMEGAIGRADFPDGDFDTLIRGIKTRLFDLPDDTILYSGHGQPTTVGREKETNPYVGRQARW
jgi:glyoxylase-like metal-dependent hydrolase (beta-lactamase superfamily II)